MPSHELWTADDNFSFFVCVYEYYNVGVVQFATEVVTTNYTYKEAW